MVFGEVVSTNKASIVLKETSITGTIANTFASFIIEQKFENTSTKEETCQLRINGGNDFIVYNVKVTVGDKVTDFKVRRIEEAKEGVSQAKKEGLSYGYAERSNKSPNELIFDLGNMPGRKKFNVHIETSFVAKLRDEKTLVFNIPHDREYKSFPISLNIDVKMEGIKSVEGVDFVKTKEGGKIKVNKKAIDKIVFHMNDPLSSSAVSVKVGNDNYIGLSVIPDIEKDTVSHFEFIILIDCSGSMSGKPIAVARETLALFLHSIPFGSYFNVYRFGSTFESFFSESVQYTEENLEKALNITKNMNADLGGTYLYPPLNDIFSKKGKNGFVRQVFLLTDGEVFDTDHILTLAYENRSSTRCFTFGIGDGVSRDFIEEFAEAANGSSAFISDSSEISSVVIKQLTSAIKPVVANFQIDHEGIESIELTPCPIPPLFSSQITCIFLKNASGTILVEGEAFNYVYEETIEPVESNVHIDKLYAFNIIHDLEYSLTSAPEVEKEKIKERIINQSLMSGIVSKFTAICDIITEGNKQQIVLSNQESDIRSRIQAIQDNLIASQLSIKNSLDIALTRGESLETLLDDRANLLSVDSEQFRIEANKKSSGGFFSWIGSLFCRNQEDNQDDITCKSHPIASRKQIHAMEAESIDLDPLIYDNKENEEEKHVVIPTNEIVVTLMTTQKFEGFWNDKEFVEEKSKCKLELDEISGDQLVTVFALALLEIYGEESMWRIVYDKALSWLKKQNPSYDWKKAIEDAKKKIKK